MPETIASPPPVTRFTYHPQPAASIPVALSVNELLFVNEYFRNGRNATQAYRTVHPKAKHTSANVSACRVLARASVKAEVERRIRYEGGITRDFLESSLLHWHARALAKDDHAAGAAILMDCAKLAGFLVEKRDVTTRDETALQPDAMVAELRRVLSPQSN